MHFFSLIYFNNHLRVSKRLTIHHQKVAASTLIVLAASQSKMHDKHHMLHVQ
jgi:hypothetical protein